MTEQEKTNFLRYANRPGKRKVKPTNLFFDIGGADEDSENDEDFAINSDGDDDGSASNSSDGSENEESGESGTDDNDEESQESMQVDGVNSSILNNDKKDKKSSELCCICLNPSNKDMPLCKCDRCQLIVHESCYGIIDDEAESVSSGADLPWFCEPCMFGLVEPPYCEMCPNRFGAFKKTDVGGNWVHILCAHYIEKTTFADDDKFQGVSYQEIDFKQFGRRPCNGCENKLESRVGIVVQCESGLCKNFYHPTCAQKLGLLVPMEPHETDGHLLCKKHSLSEDIKPRKKKFEIMYGYEMKRMIGIRKRRIGVDEERRRIRQSEEYNKRIKALEGVNILHPGPRNVKRQRLVQSSMEFIDAFSTKAELALGISKEDFIKQFEKVPSENLNLGSELSLSEEFSKYFEYRETVQFDEYEQYIEELKENKDETLTLEKELNDELQELKKNHKKIIDSSNKHKDETEKFFNILNALGAKGISKAFMRIPKSFPHESFNGTNTPSTSTSTGQKTTPPKRGRPLKLTPKSEAKSPTKENSNKSVADDPNMPILKPLPKKQRLEVITLSDDDDDEPPKLIPTPNLIKLTKIPSGSKK